MPPYRKSQRGWLTGNSLAPITGRGLLIPGDLAFVMAVNGALDELTYEWNWEKFGTVTPEAAADAMRVMLAGYFESEYEPVSGGSSLFLTGLSADGSTRPLVVSLQAAQFMGGFYTMNAPVVNDYIVWVRMLQAGTWNYALSYYRQTTNGICTVTVQPSSGFLITVNSHDLRGAALANQQVQGSFTLPVSGQTGIRLNMFGTSGAGYALPVTALALWRPS